MLGTSAFSTRMEFSVTRAWYFTRVAVPSPFRAPDHPLSVRGLSSSTVENFADGTQQMQQSDTESQRSNNQ
jgi:hypothetical protein